MQYLQPSCSNNAVASSRNFGPSTDCSAFIATLFSPFFIFSRRATRTALSMFYHFFAHDRYLQFANGRAILALVQPER